MILCLLPICSIGQTDKYKSLATLNKIGLKVDSNFLLTFSQANQLMNAWDSLYEIGKKIQVANTLPDEIWESCIQQEINWAKAQNKTKLYNQLHYYLAHLYHSQKLYSKSIPIQEQLIHKDRHLSKLQLKKTYAKLEKAYLLTNQIDKALVIRKKDWTWALL